LLFSGIAFADQGAGNGVKANINDLMGQNLEDLLNMPIESAALKATTQKLLPEISTLLLPMNRQYGATSIADALDKMVPGINIAMYPNFNELVTVRGIATDSNLKTELLSDGLDIGTIPSTVLPAEILTLL